MAAVKEREIATIVGPKELTKEFSSSWKSRGSDGPGEPPEFPPPGGRGGGGGFWFWALLLLFALAALFFGGASSEVYYAVNSGAVSPLAMFAAWAVLIATSLVWIRAALHKDVPSPSMTMTAFEQAIFKYRKKLVQRYWDGLLIIILCFHASVFSQQFALISLIEVAAVIATLAHVVERLRLRFFPQDVFDVEDLLSVTGA